MRLVAQVIDSRHLRYNAVMQSLLNGFLGSCKPGQLVEIDIKRLRPSKSRQQVKAIWGMIVPATKAALDHAGIDCMGVPLNEEMVKQILYRFCGGVGENGKVISLSQQNVDQASEFFERCRAWLAETFGVQIPDPDKNWRNDEHGRQAETQT